MLSLTKIKPQDYQNPSPSSVIMELPPSIRALIEPLPMADQEIFAYLILHPLEDFVNAPQEASNRLREPKSAQSSPREAKSNVQQRVHNSAQILPTTLNEAVGGWTHRKAASHQPSFSCGCFPCYINYWSRWNSSPNEGSIHQALLLNELEAGELFDSESRKMQVVTRTSWKREKGSKSNEDYEIKSEPSVEVQGHALHGCDTQATRLFHANETRKLPIPFSDECIPTISKASTDVVDDAHTAVPKQSSAETWCVKASASEVKPTMERMEKCSEFAQSLIGKNIKESKAQKKRSSQKTKIAISNSKPKQTVKENDKNQKGKQSVTNARDELPGKCKSKQVAPLNNKYSSAAEPSCCIQPQALNNEQKAAANRELDVSRKGPRYLMSRGICDALSFIADRLLGLWYRRRHRRSVAVV